MLDSEFKKTSFQNDVDTDIDCDSGSYYNSYSYSDHHNNNITYVVMIKKILVMIKCLESYLMSLVNR